MILKIFSVYDVKTGVYERPFFSPTRGDAMRAFSDISQDAGHPIGKHPEDYSLFDLGYFDNTKAGFEIGVPERICGALDFVRGVEARQEGYSLHGAGNGVS